MPVSWLILDYKLLRSEVNVEILPAKDWALSVILVMPSSIVCRAAKLWKILVPESALALLPSSAGMSLVMAPPPEIGAVYVVAVLNWTPDAWPVIDVSMAVLRLVNSEATVP